MKNKAIALLLLIALTGVVADYFSDNCNGDCPGPWGPCGDECTCSGFRRPYSCVSTSIVESVKKHVVNEEG